MRGCVDRVASTDGRNPGNSLLHTLNLVMLRKITQMGGLREHFCRAAILRISCTCLFLAGFASADDWPTAQHDLQRTGLTSSTLDPKTLKLSWTGPELFTQPIIVGNAVIAI